MTSMQDTKKASVDESLERVTSVSASMSRGKRALSHTEPELLRQVKSQQSQGRKSSAASAVLSGLHVGSLLRTWENISKINYWRLESESGDHSMTDSRRRSSGTVVQEDKEKKKMSLSTFVPTNIDKTDDDIIPEQFPIVVTSLQNEDQLWGCFYTFPELYGDAYSPVVRVRRVQDVPELVGGVLTRDMVTACLSYLKRTPILGDYVYIKLDLSYKYLVNIEVIQHYKYLVYLDLSFNYLTELTVLSHLLYLQFFSVSFNRLNTVLDYDTPQWFLTEVHYKYNSVKKIRDLSMFWSITILDLSHNNIKVISGLENLHYLRHLDLSFNHIQILENLDNLRLLWLDVSYNNISSFEYNQESGLWTLYHLEYLNLNENNLTSMKIFCGCTRIKELHARNNRLGVLLELAVYMRQLRRLTILDLRANPICSTPGYKDVVINTFPVLMNLDAQELDPVDQRTIRMNFSPDVGAFACRRLLRLLYIEQLSRARVSPFVPPADTTEVPMVIFVGYEAVGKGTLVRSLAEKCSKNVELALLHTTASYHITGHYREVNRNKFDEMLLAGEFLTYNEKDGESYGLSREEAFIKDGKVKIASMDLISALMMSKRGRRPYMILTTCLDKTALAERQAERKELRSRLQEFRKSIELPLEKSTLQVLISGRILVTGILNEILMYLPEDKEESEFVIESQCSLLMDSETRKAAKDYAKEVNMLTLLSSGTSSLDEICKAYKSMPNDASLCSLYKESQNTDEYASDIANNGHSSFHESAKKSGGGDTARRSSSKPDKLSDTSRPKSVDFSRYVSSTWKGGSFGANVSAGLNSVKSSKSVTFTSQDAGDAATSAPRESLPREFTMTGMLVDAPPTQSQQMQTQAIPKSLSTKFPLNPPAMSHHSLDDADLWLMFLIETGLLQTSDTFEETQGTSAEKPRRETKVDDPEYIMKQLAFYASAQESYHPSFTTNIRDEYEEIHRTKPGFFWDTITMDDPDPNKPFQKAKQIIRDIVESQSHFKPMFNIDFTNRLGDYPMIERKAKIIANQIAPKRFFF